jgi:predicted phage-related endonuclease
MKGTHMKKHEKPTHGSLEWLTLRHRDEQGRIRFGASEAPVLMGVSKYRNITDLAIEKWSEPEVKEQNDAMLRGHILEPALLEYASQVLGEQLNTPDEMFSNGRFIATLDGITEDGETIVEAKTSTAYSCDDPMPRDFYWQAIAQLACNPDAARVIFVVLDKRMRLATPQHWVVDAVFAQDDIAELMVRADEVGEMLDNKQLPPGSPMTEDHVKALYPSPSGTKELGTAGIVAVTRYQAAKAAKDDAESEEKSARNELTALLGDAEVGTVDGQQVVSFKSRSTGARLDTKQLELDYPEIVAKYRKPAGTTRVLKALGE